MATQIEKAKAFRALHQRDSAFVIPNPWDVGTARVLASMGFEALATTSSGFAFTLGKRDNAAGREAVLAHVAALAAAAEIPVSGDLENGFGETPEAAAETIRLGAAAGLVGGSIEDSTGDRERPVFELEHAAERVAAAVGAARSLSFPFTLTARAENHIVGRPDLGDTIRRLQAYQEAGADVLYAPGLMTREDISAVVRSVDRPVNVLAGLRGMTLDVGALSELGVRRISVGGLLAQTAFGAFWRAAQELASSGTFAFAEGAVSYGTIRKVLGA